MCWTCSFVSDILCQSLLLYRHTLLLLLLLLLMWLLLLLLLLLLLPPLPDALAEATAEANGGGRGFGALHSGYMTPTFLGVPNKGMKSEVAT